MKIDLKEERVEVSFSSILRKETLMKSMPPFFNPIRSHPILQKKYLTSLFLLLVSRKVKKLDIYFFF